MNTKNIFSSLLVLVVVLGVVGVVNRAFGTFNGPTDAFPNCDTASVQGCNTPLNIGTAKQIKNGSLSVNAFYGAMNSEFAQDLNLDKQANKTYSVGGVSFDPALCVTSAGKVEVCSDASHSAQVYSSAARPSSIGNSDLMAFTLTLTSMGSTWAKWSVGSESVLLSNDPSHVFNSGTYPNLQIIGYNGVPNEGQRLQTGMYQLKIGDANNYTLSTRSVISATYISGTSTTTNLKLTLWQTGNNEFTFSTSDDSTLNDMNVGDRIVFLYQYGYGF